MDDKIELAIRKIKESSFTLAFTGAGISVESGIPPFRGKEGLWNKYNPEVLDISYFYSNGEESWKYIKEIFYTYINKAQPNDAHFALARMEAAGYVHAVVTQNIDNLHQLAGSRKIYEFHGNSSRLVCPECNKVVNISDVDLTRIPPRCKADNSILKPDFVFFGEGIPTEAWDKSFESAEQAEVCLIIGSTGEVVPASYVPQKASDRGAFIIEINPEESHFTHTITDLHLKGKAAEVMSSLAGQLFKN